MEKQKFSATKIWPSGIVLWQCAALGYEFATPTVGRLPEDLRPQRMPGANVYSDHVLLGLCYKDYENSLPVRCLKFRKRVICHVQD